MQILPLGQTPRSGARRSGRGPRRGPHHVNDLRDGPSVARDSRHEIPFAPGAAREVCSESADDLRCSRIRREVMGSNLHPRRRDGFSTSVAAQGRDVHRCPPEFSRRILKHLHHATPFLSLRSRYAPYGRANLGEAESNAPASVESPDCLKKGLTPRSPHHLHRDRPALALQLLREPHSKKRKTKKCNRVPDRFRHCPRDTSPPHSIVFNARRRAPRKNGNK